MPCMGPSDADIASETARNNEQVHSLLRRLCSKVPDSYIDEVPRLKLWWNNGKPEPAAKDTLDHHTEMLCTLCQRADKSSINYIGQTMGLEAWWTEHKRLDAERAERDRATRNQSKREKALKRKLEAAGLTPEELTEFGHRSLNTILS